MLSATHIEGRDLATLWETFCSNIFALVMKDARNSILQSSAFQWIGRPALLADLHASTEIPPMAFLDLAFVDDYAITAHGPDIPAIEHFACQAVHAVSQAARKRGLLLNLAPGKTELLFNYRGKGARQAKMALVDTNGLMRWKTDEHDYSVVVTRAYKHPGSWLQSSHKHNKEMAATTTPVRRSWGPLHRPFYSKGHVSMHAKLQAFRSLTMSRLLYNMHILAGLSDKNLDQRFEEASWTPSSWTHPGCFSLGIGCRDTQRPYWSAAPW